MARQRGQLTALTAARLTGPGLYGAGGGLYLQVAASGTKSWIFRYQHAGRRRDMGLGAFEAVGLADARKKAAEARRSLSDGIDPIEARRALIRTAAADRAKGATFKDAATRYIGSHQAGWKNAKHAAQWAATLEAYVFPKFGTVSVAAIDVPMVLKVLEPIWATKTETARRVRGRIEVILDWAQARGMRAGENPARWRGVLQHLLPRQPKATARRHHPALPYTRVGEFMAELRRQDGTAARALEFTILTAARTSETIGARWEEINLPAGLWIVPAAKIKAARDHRVPLADPALALLRSQAKTHQSDFVFPGGRRNRPLSNMAMANVLKRMREAKLPVAMAIVQQGNVRRPFTVHGFRSTFRDWAAEQTNYPSEVAEMALAHAVGDKVEAAYRRGDMLEKRRRIMRDWAAYCGRIGKTEGNVVVLR